MTRLLQGPAVTAAPRALMGPEPSLDAFSRELVLHAQETAYHRGLREGRDAGRREAAGEAAAAAARLGAAVAEAADRLAAELRALRAHQAEEAGALALAIAEVVLGREPHDGGQALVGRIRDALAAIDDGPLLVAVSPGDEAFITQALGSRPGIAVVGDPSLAAGDARITGPWAEAELLRDTVLGAVREVLDGSA